MDIVEQIAAQAKRRRDAIKRKVHPALSLILRHYKEVLDAQKALGDNAPRQLIEEVQSHNLRDLKKSLAPWEELPTSLLDILYIHIPEPVTDQVALLAFLHFQRHGRSLMQDIQLANNRDPAAWKRLIRAETDFAVIVCGTGKVKALQNRSNPRRRNAAWNWPRSRTAYGRRTCRFLQCALLVWRRA